MTIGINASAAFIQPRTGVEEYVFQIIKHLTMLEKAKEHRFVLYVANKVIASEPKASAAIPRHLSSNFQIKQLKWLLPMWTQIRLSAEMAFNQPDVLFIPVHILPLIHPKNSVVTIHGLEYEYYPEMYPWRHLRYLRWSTKYALKHARKIIAVSENTKNDLMKLYGAKTEKIKVVHHGFDDLSLPAKQNNPVEYHEIASPPSAARNDIIKPYILFIGRLELKKNILGILDAYKILKEKYKIPHKLVLVGPPGFGYDKIKLKIKNLLKIENCKLKIKELGYVSDDEKWNLFRNAEAFLFPSFYEGFGLPILEVQAFGCPVITSNVSSLPEIAGQGAILIDPKNIEQIAAAVYKTISDQQFKKDLIAKGYQNIKRFSWQKCAQETLAVLTE